jgi:hypothetical protein
MEKKHLFSIIAFLFSVLVLGLFEIKAGFAYAMWLFAINVGLQYAYHVCKTDKEEEI